MERNRKTTKKGKIFVISAPSGAGKSTLAEMLLRSRAGLVRSVSYTTRKPRGSEKDGKDYFFITKSDFEKKAKKGFFAEWAKVFTDLYGTSCEFLDGIISKGKNAMLIIDTQGAFQIRKKYPEAILIFVAPPSFAELKKRLVGRGTEEKRSLKKRLETAKKELKESRQYDHIIINDDLKKAFSDLKHLINSYIKAR